MKSKIPKKFYMILLGIIPFGFLCSLLPLLFLRNEEKDEKKKEQNVPLASTLLEKQKQKAPPGPTKSS